MGLVADVAQRAPRMLSRNYLGKTRGFRRILFVTSPAKVGDIGQGRLMRRRVVRLSVSRLRPMAGFASHMGVLPGIVHLGLIRMAHIALLMPGIRNGLLTNGIERARIVVAVLAESFRNECGAGDEENAKSGQQHGRGADQVAGIAKKLTHAAPFQGTPASNHGLPRGRRCCIGLASSGPNDPLVENSYKSILEGRFCGVFLRPRNAKCPMRWVSTPKPWGNRLRSPADLPSPGFGFAIPVDFRTSTDGPLRGPQSVLGRPALNSSFRISPRTPLRARWHNPMRGCSGRIWRAMCAGTRLSEGW
jgi:hypothetical protein